MSSALPPDPYKILGVSKDAQLPEIRSAHRKLVLKCHPDKVQDPALKAIKQDEFQKVQQAYELLSNEDERLKYDDNVKLAELRKEMAAAKGANTSAPRAASARTYDVNIRTAEPRADTFKTTSSTYRSPNKMYSQYPSRSWDEEIHRSSPIFEEPRAARRAASYEKDHGPKVYERTTYEKSSRQEEESAAERDRRRRKDDEKRIREAERERQERRAAEKERERAAEKAARKQAERAAERAAEEKEAQKEALRRQRKAQEKLEKEREKTRKAEALLKKQRNVPVYIEDPPESEFYYKDKKSSSSKKREEKEVRSRSTGRESVREEAPPPTPALPADPSTAKMDDNILFAAAYMDKSRRGPGLSRTATFHESSRFAPPAPTPPAATPFAAPPIPPIPTEDEARRSKTRRSSDSKRDKSSHKKSPAKEAAYNIVEASPTARNMAQFASTHSSPMGGSPPKVSRATTFDAGSYSRPIPVQRAQTFHTGVDDSRGRHRSRMQSQTVSEDESEDEPRHSRRSHRKIVDDPVPIDYAGRSTRYTVNNANRAVPVESKSSYYHREQSPPRRAYYVERPSMDRGSSGYSGFGDSVKTSAAYNLADVTYSDIPRRATQDRHYETYAGYA